MRGPDRRRRRERLPPHVRFRGRARCFPCVATSFSKSRSPYGQINAHSIESNDTLFDYNQIKTTFQEIVKRRARIM